jgi:hypothetical protein
MINDANITKIINIISFIFNIIFINIILNDKENFKKIINKAKIDNIIMKSLKYIQLIFLVSLIIMFIVYYNLNIIFELNENYLLYFIQIFIMLYEKYILLKFNWFFMTEYFFN